MLAEIEAKRTAIEDASDLDFLVEFESRGPEGYADRFFGLLESLEELFGRRVDLVIDPAIRNPYFRDAVDERRVPLYRGEAAPSPEDARTT